MKNAKPAGSPVRIPRRRFTLTVLIVSAVWLLLPEHSGAESRTVWLAGHSLDRALDHSRFTIQLSGLSLSVAVDKLATQVAKPKRLAIMLDRRVDPGQAVELDVRSVSLRTALQQLAEKHHLAVSRLGSIIYLGLADRAGRLEEVSMAKRRDLQSIAKQKRRPFIATQTLEWAELAEPRDLVRQLTSTSGLKVIHLEQVPHDLWPAKSFPPLFLADRLTLVLFGFDLTYTVSQDGKSVTIVPMD